jgi:hypothetical protein
MRSGIVNIVLGLVGIGLGLSGKFVFFGTQESWPLVAVGGAAAAWGVVQVLRDRPRGPRQTSGREPGDRGGGR